jgi:hypothetical protein
MTKVTHVIGRTVNLSIPAADLFNLPAKVDTGADSSTIWASNVREENGVLSFTLLDPSSDRYTGKQISTKDYVRVIVKNSFGASEHRYRVNLSVEIEGRRIKARFSLANRQLKSYPSLIGRRLINKKFLVDVSKAN